MKKTFTTTAPDRPKYDYGYGGGSIHPSEIITKLFKAEIPGAILCCYMLRRFGWPNAGSDSYKNLMEWVLTTPVPGLLLSVTPYLGNRGDAKYDDKRIFNCCNLHFGIRFTKEVGRKIDFDAGREAFFQRRHKFIQNWWKTKGIKLYTWGYGLEAGDTDELVHQFAEDDKNKGKVWGLWKRTASMKHKGDIPKQAQMVDWWLSRLIEKKHPEVKLPKMTGRERARQQNPFRLKCEEAIRKTANDLLQPTYVRDISFTCFGDIEHDAEAIKHYKNQESSGYFLGAGYTPEYWFTKASKKEKAGKE